MLFAVACDLPYLVICVCILHLSHISKLPCMANCVWYISCDRCAITCDNLHYAVGSSILTLTAVWLVYYVSDSLSVILGWWAFAYNASHVYRCRVVLMESNITAGCRWNMEPITNSNWSPVTIPRRRRTVPGAFRTAPGGSGRFLVGPLIFNVAFGSLRRSVALWWAGGPDLSHQLTYLLISNNSLFLNQILNIHI